MIVREVTPEFLTKTLTPRQRKVWEMRGNGLSHRAIARIMGFNPGSAAISKDELTARVKILRERRRRRAEIVSGDVRTAALVVWLPEDTEGGG